MSTEKITYLEIFLNLKNNYKYVTIFVYIKEYNMEVETFWLERRLKELNKTKKDFASCLGIQQSHVSAILSGIRKIQAAEIKKTAEFLEFDRTAFLDFISGDITEDQLWNYTPPQQISDEDLNLLKAVKTIATRPATPDVASDSQKSPALPGRTSDEGR